MTILENLKNIISSFSVPVETGVFSNDSPDTYSVLTPLTSTFEVFADNKPTVDVQSVRISIYTKHNYLTLVNGFERRFINEGFTITYRKYIGHEDDTKYHHYVIDVSKEYEF